MLEPKYKDNRKYGVSETGDSLGYRNFGYQS